MNFGHVPDPFGQWWPITVHLLDKAVKRGGNSWSDVVGELRAQTAQLWLAVDVAPVAAMVTRRLGDTLEIWLAGGAIIPGCIEFLLIAEQAAVQDGMTNGRLSGRKGWARVLAGYGWRRDGDDLVKELACG